MFQNIKVCLQGIIFLTNHVGPFKDWDNFLKIRFAFIIHTYYYKYKTWNQKSWAMVRNFNFPFISDFDTYKGIF